jgi:hypothetical protein
MDNLNNKLSNEAEIQPSCLADVMHSAYKAGYEQRVIDQLQGALDGNPIGSHYNDEKLNKLANKYVSKHCV